VTAFDSSHPARPEDLASCDVIISFLPGPAFESYLPMLIDSGKPVVTGTTACDWPEDIDDQLKNMEVSWIRASNFSLGMNVVRPIIQQFRQLKELYPEGQFSIHEIHHTHKKDAPSGTALSWEEWLNAPVEISSERTGDVVGIHQIRFTSEEEEIELVHKARDRGIFAKGALWAAEMVTGGELPAGLHEFTDCVAEYLNKKQ
jgi:4-hydroxy-tetrahydrodipicolinate reductase